MPGLVADVEDEQLFKSILTIASEIARRSAKHSAEFLRSSAEVSQALRQFNDAQVTTKALELARRFCRPRRRYCGGRMGRDSTSRK